jgi:hypothetical protein
MICSYGVDDEHENREGKVEDWNANYTMVETMFFASSSWYILLATLPNPLCS